MKYVIVLGDGMADRPLQELSGKTPLEAAVKPCMDSIARKGRTGMLKTLRDDMPFGSDIANMSILGYDPLKYYPGGRGPLEAASMGIELGAGDMAFRCNLVTQENGCITDYSGGHISSGEARELISEVERVFGDSRISFHPGVGYRHILLLKDAGIDPSDVSAVPPHDIVGEKVSENLIKSQGGSSAAVAELLNNMMMRSIGILEEHPVNRKRVAGGKRPANMLWFWGGGKRPDLPLFCDLYGISGSLISAVDLLKGLARYAGLRVVEVPGSTGYFDTDYEAKARYALDALKEADLVYIHVEAPDEAGHEGNIAEKISAIENIDLKVVRPVVESLERDGIDYSIAVLPDHATPVSVKTHTAEPVPFAIYSSGGGESDGADSYSEKACASGSLGLVDGPDFMRLFTRKK